MRRLSFWTICLPPTLLGEGEYRHQRQQILLPSFHKVILCMCLLSFYRCTSLKKKHGKSPLCFSIKKQQQVILDVMSLSLWGTRARIHVHTHTHKHAHACSLTHTNTRTHACTHTHTHVFNIQSQVSNTCQNQPILSRFSSLFHSSSFIVRSICIGPRVSLLISWF